MKKLNQVSILSETSTNFFKTTIWAISQKLKVYSKTDQARKLDMNHNKINV